MNVGRPPVRRPVSSSTPRISSLSSPGGNKQARSCTRYHPRGAWCAHRDDDEEGGTERNEKTKRKRSIVSCKYVGRVHMRAVLEGQPRSKEETERERELVQVLGWEKRGVFSGKRITGVSMVFD